MKGLNFKGIKKLSLKKLVKGGTSSIRFKLILMPLLLVFIAVSLIGGISSYFMRDSLLNEMETQGFNLVEQVAREIKNSSRTEYQKLVTDLAATENIVYASFISTELKTVVSSDQKQIGVELAEGSKEAIINKEQYSSQLTYGEEKINVLEVIMPVEQGGKLIGAVSIGLSMETVMNAIGNNMKLIIIFAIAIFISLGGVLYYISRYIIKALEETQNQLNKIASGDFTTAVSQNYITKKDEFGKIFGAISHMQFSIRQMIQQIAAASEQVAVSSEELTINSQQSAVAAEEVAKTIEEIAKGASEQAKDTEEGVMHIDELGLLIEQEVQYIGDLNNSADEINQLKDDGFRVIDILVEKTKASNVATKEIHETIKNTDESAEKIVVASQMIKNIANQTNLLALNAAIEAARAGEAGRGFAVVADEIRKLAEQSNQFTEEIAKVIAQLTEKTGHAVKTMIEVGTIVEEQNQSVEDTYEKFQGIATAIDNIKDVIDAISATTMEMEYKKSDMIEIIQNLSAISEENAASTEEASASVEEQTATMEELANASQTLSMLAKEMQDNITKFKF